MKPNPLMTKTKYCAHCSKEALSVCNFASKTFIGCGRPFCEDHGLFPPVKLMNLGEEEVRVHEEEHYRQRLAVKCQEPACQFRICDKCLEQQPSITSSKIVPLLLILLLVPVFGFLLAARARASSSGSFLSPGLNQQFDKLTQFQLVEHIEWHLYRTPNCKRFWSSGIEQENSSWISASLYCTCEYLKLPSKSEVKDGRIKSYAPCGRSEPCPPDGTSYIGISGKCYSQLNSKMPPNATYDTGLVVGGLQVKCPYLTRYSSEHGACVYQICSARSKQYYLTRPGFKCTNCPLYTTRNWLELFCHFGKHRKEYSKRYYRRQDMSLGFCPQEQALRPVHHGYRPRVIDEFGYYWCPVFEGEPMADETRTCEWYEMALRQSLGCRSPCQPYLEKWDFLLKKCVQGETECTQFNQMLAATGECYSKASIYNLEGL